MQKYKHLGDIGNGAYGVVSRAQNLSTGETVAVKRMKKKFFSWDECLALKEVAALRRVHHPNVVKLREAIRENNELYLVFENMDKNLYQVMREREKPFSENQIRHIMYQVLSAVNASHKAGIFHRDMKPENLLIKGDIVKIADLGLAKDIRTRPPFTEYVSTRWYRAPEVLLRMRNYNSPVDIWGCGLVLGELMLNYPMFPGTSDADQFYRYCTVLGSPTSSSWEEGLQCARKLNHRFPSFSGMSLAQVFPDSSAEAIDLLNCMLRYNPNARLSAQQLLSHPFFQKEANAFNGCSTSLSFHPSVISDTKQPTQQQSPQKSTVASAPPPQAAATAPPVVQYPQMVQQNSFGHPAQPAQFNAQQRYVMNRSPTKTERVSPTKAARYPPVNFFSSSTQRRSSMIGKAS